jgi:hypothetical protein
LLCAIRGISWLGKRLFGVKGEFISCFINFHSWMCTSTLNAPCFLHGRSENNILEHLLDMSLVIPNIIPIANLSAVTFVLTLLDKSRLWSWNYLLKLIIAPSPPRLLCCKPPLPETSYACKIFVIFSSRHRNVVFQYVTGTFSSHTTNNWGCQPKSGPNDLYVVPISWYVKFRENGDFLVYRNKLVLPSTRQIAN